MSPENAVNSGPAGSKHPSTDNGKEPAKQFMTSDQQKRANPLPGIFLLLVLATIAFPAFASGEYMLTPHTAEYRIKISVLSGKLHTEFKATDDGFSAHSVLRASGIAKLFVRGDVTESSTFDIVDNGVRPLQYSSDDRISKEDKSMAFDFDWQHSKVSGLINHEDFDLDLQGLVHDRVSIQYQLMLDLLNDSASDEYVLIDHKGLKPLQISNIGNKKIKVPFGEFEAIGIQHRKQDSDRITTLWCAEELGYLPVLIEQHRDGKLAVRAVLKNYQPIEADASGIESATANSADHN